MFTRKGPHQLHISTNRSRQGHWVAAALLGALLVTAGGTVSRAWSAPGSGDPFEYRIPGPGNAGEGRAHRQGELGNPGGNTDADPDEFSVNSVGIRRPDVAYQPIGSGGAAQTGGWLSHLHLSLTMLLRIWLTLGVGR